MEEFLHQPLMLDGIISWWQFNKGNACPQLPLEMDWVKFSRWLCMIFLHESQLDTWWLQRQSGMTVSWGRVSVRRAFVLSRAMMVAFLQAVGIHCFWMHKLYIFGSHSFAIGPKWVISQYVIRPWSVSHFHDAESCLKLLCSEWLG